MKLVPDKFMKNCVQILLIFKDRCSYKNEDLKFFNFSLFWLAVFDSFYNSYFRTMFEKTPVLAKLSPVLECQTSCYFSHCNGSRFVRFKIKDFNLSGIPRYLIEEKSFMTKFPLNKDTTKCIYILSRKCTNIHKGI